ncbi:MAG TPA: hypothetical protein VGM51_14940 [Armatimonadota bacterium]
MTLHATALDKDNYSDPLVCNDWPPRLSWSNNADASTSNEFHAPATPGTYTVTCLAQDFIDVLGDVGYDGDQSLTWTVKVIGGEISSTTATLR